MAFTEGVNLPKYNDLLNAIEADNNECIKLRAKLQSYNDQLRSLQILKNPQIARNKLIQVHVKVFRSLKDLLEVYPEKVDHDKLCSTNLNYMCEESNIFMIDIYMSRIFLDKLMSKDWLVTVTVSTDASTICKSLPLAIRENVTSAILRIPRITSNDEIVGVSLTSLTNGLPVELFRLQTDISYKFNNAKPSSSSLEENILKINRMYSLPIGSDDFGEKKDFVPLRYKLHCSLNEDAFVERLMHNAYQNLNPLQMIRSEGILRSTIEINDQMVRFELDTNKKYLRIEATGQELGQLKKYFISAINNGTSKKAKVVKKDFANLQDGQIAPLKDAKRDLMEILKYSRIHIHDLLNIYDKYYTFIENNPL